MNYKKKILATMPKCYAIATMHADDKDSFLIGVEKSGSCRRFSLDGYSLETVCDGPGGVMTMLQVPNCKNQFLSTSEFYSPNCGGENARIVIYTHKNDGSWTVETLCELPYVHRFGIVKGADGKNWLLACTIKSACEYREDWRYPGKVFVAPLPENLNQFHAGNPLKMTVLRDGQLKNHGFFTASDLSYALISTQEGVFKYTPPSVQNGEWTIDCLLKKPVSDMTLVDFDRDGKQELLTFSEFHGDELCVYHLDEQGQYKQVYQHPEKLPFLHAIWGGMFNGEPCAIVGHRKGNRDLLIIRFDLQSGYTVNLIDHDRGPTNVLVYSNKGTDCIVAANRETDEVALYTVKD